MSDATDTSTTAPSTIDVGLVHRRMGHHHPDIPAVFLWSEKAGCTSLLQWFLAQTGDLEEAAGYSDFIHRWEMQVWKARPGYDRELVERLEAGTSVFKLVRDPFVRAVSQYLLALTRVDRPEHFTVPMRRDIRQHVHGTADTSNETSDETGESFSFLEYLDWLASQDLDTINDHLAPQYTALERRLTELGRPVEPIHLESFDVELARVAERLGLPPVDLARVSESTHHTTRADHPDADPEAVVRLRPPAPLPDDYPIPRSDLFFTRETVDRIAAIYAADIREYGYSPPAVRDEPRPAAEHLVFVHVPKTAGTTLRPVLRRQFAADRVHEFGADAVADVAAWNELDQTDRDRVGLLSGHMAYGLADTFTDPADTVVVLREPAARVASWWSYVQRTPGHRLHERVARDGCRLRDLVGDPSALMLDNGQVRLLSGVWGDAGFGAVTEADLQAAELHLLDPRTFVGVTEHFDATVVALGARYGWWRVQYAPANVSPDRPPLSDDDRAVIDEMTRLDQQLYRTAVRVFHERWAELPAHVRARRRLIGYESRVAFAAASARARIDSRLSRRTGRGR